MKDFIIKFLALAFVGGLVVYSMHNQPTTSQTDTKQHEIDSVRRKIDIEQGLYKSLGVDPHANTANDQLTLDRLTGATPTPVPHDYAADYFAKHPDPVTPDPNYKAPKEVRRATAVNTPLVTRQLIEEAKRLGLENMPQKSWSELTPAEKAQREKIEAASERARQQMDEMDEYYKKMGWKD